MMAFGTLYTHNPSPRVFAILAVAKAHGLELEVVQADKQDGANYEQLLKINPLGQVPTFVGADGFVLTECIPIALYITSRSDTTTLLGRNQREYYQVLQWMSLANSELLPAIGGVILPLIGRHQKVRMNNNDCMRSFYTVCKRLENHLKSSKYLVGEEVTLADLFTVGAMLFAVRMFHGILTVDYPRLISWFHEVHDMPILKAVLGEFQIIDVPMPTLEEQ
ncbi:glutathione S-transferase [Xylaria scruposa]|nr:glutathione S-transferase [Xylaria scruposa]